MNIETRNALDATTPCLISDTNFDKNPTSAVKTGELEKVGNKFPMKSVILISFSPKKGDENQTQR